MRTEELFFCSKEGSSNTIKLKWQAAHVPNLGEPQCRVIFVYFGCKELKNF
jgi:hypothetical protein